MVTHGRDRGGDDVGPKLLYYDSRGKGVLKGTHLLDGCAVTLCAHVGRSDFGFDQGRKRVIRRRFNVGDPRARVRKTKFTLRDRLER